jgi:hypothetical protein
MGKFFAIPTYLNLAMHQGGLLAKIHNIILCKYQNTFLLEGIVWVLYHNNNKNLSK